MSQNTSKTKSKEPQTEQSHVAPKQETDVLYQKMGDRWFAFSVIENEVYFGSLTQEEIDIAEGRTAPATDSKTFKIAGNS